MRHVELRTPNLTLVLQSTQEILAWIAAMGAAERADVSPDWIARVRASATPDPWTHFFAMVHNASGASVGSCGFKGPPGADGTVEIAYGVDPAHQGRGHATEAAGALVAYAFANASVRAVRANTRPESNASGRVLTKCGFRRTGEIVDPEDGLVWTWEIARPRAAGAN